MSAFDGILFFPVTPFDRAGRVDLDVLEQHVAERLGERAGAVFPACGTGEFHALTADEVDVVVRTASAVTAGRVPVIAGVGGSVAAAVEGARRAADAGADGVLLLPPYLVAGSQEGLLAYVDAVASAGPLPVIVYHRGTARYTPTTVARLATDPRVIGFKDGIGDVALAQEIVSAVAATGRTGFSFFNGLLTAELTQGAYRGLGIPLYSSAAFAMAPRLANAHYDAYATGDDARRLELLDVFYRPLVALRDETPGFGVSLVKAGLRLSGLPVGGVRAPLTDPTPEQEERLAALLADAHAWLDR